MPILGWRLGLLSRRLIVQHHRVDGTRTFQICGCKVVGGELYTSWQTICTGSGPNEASALSTYHIRVLGAHCGQSPNISAGGNFTTKCCIIPIILLHSVQAFVYLAGNEIIKKMQTTRFQRHATTTLPPTWAAYLCRHPDFLKRFAM